MTDRIELVEYQTTQCMLIDEDALFISTQLSAQCTLQRRMDRVGYDINPNQFVGVVSLPSGRILQSSPKVPIQNLFAMLAVAFELDQTFREEVAKLERLDELLEFIVLHFVQLIEGRMRRGLYRNYVEFEENLGVVRGRIMIAQDIHQNAILRHRTFCLYSEFTRDIPENQVIRQVVHYLNGWVRSPVLRLRLHQLDKALAEVTPTNLPVSALDRIRYHRMNDDYEPIHRLCRLFLEGASVQENQGAIDFKTFLIDMNRLFEVFVARILTTYAWPEIRLQAQAFSNLDTESQIDIHLDLLVSRHGKPALIADTKYKRLKDSAAGNDDLYQVLSYCVAMNVQTGVLIYPRHAGIVSGFHSIRNSQVRIHLELIDLGMPISFLDEECRRFAVSIWSLIPVSEPAVEAVLAPQAN